MSNVENLEKFIDEELHSPIPHFICWIFGTFCLLFTLLVLAGFGIRLPIDWEIYLFNLLQNTGCVFSWLLSLVFFIGMVPVLERLAFYICYFCFSTRIRQCSENKYGKGHRNYTVQFLRSYLEFNDKAVPVTQDSVLQAKHLASNLALDNVQLKSGLKTMQICELFGPTIGFIGTLWGLIDSFGELAYGAGLNSVLSGLSLSMTTSLLGAGIYVVFLSTGYMVELLADAVDSRTDRTLRHYFDQLN